MKKSEKVREFAIMLRNQHCGQAKAAQDRGDRVGLTQEEIVCEALLSVIVRIEQEFGLEPLEFE